MPSFYPIAGALTYTNDQPGHKCQGYMSFPVLSIIKSVQPPPSFFLCSSVFLMPISAPASMSGLKELP